MKKFLVALLFLSLSLSAAFAETQGFTTGMLSKLNMTQEDFQNRFEFDKSKKTSQVQTFLSEGFSIQQHKFYDSLTALQMALEAGEIDAMSLPENVAEYVMNVNPKYTVAGITRIAPIYLALGFRKDDDPDLRNKINEALDAMKLDGTLAILQVKYILEPNPEDPEPVEFRNFENVNKKIKVAVTGDLPPIDFIAADGTPAGFNTAVIAELGKRLNMNIETVNIESVARAASLASGRVDAVFWFMYRKSDDGNQMDLPEGIVLSEPYYSWNEIFHIVPVR